MTTQNDFMNLWDKRIEEETHINLEPHNNIQFNNNNKLQY